MKDTLIIIPAYNEEKGIRGVLEGLQGFDELADVLVVNDGSQDNTVAIVRQMPVFLVSHPINLGYGAALQTAFRFAEDHGYRYVVQYDADGQHHRDDLRTLIQEMRKGTDDVVIGSRVLGDPSFAPGFRKRIAFFWFTSMIRLLTKKKLTDPTSGLRGLARRAFSFYAVSSSFPSDFPDADTIIHMLFQGFGIREVPIRSLPRTEGVSMHMGLLKHAVYMLKVTISILAILIYYILFDRRKMV